MSFTHTPIHTLAVADVMCLVVVVVARFERPPDKRFETEAVQPSQYSQTTLNKTLGVRSKDVAGARVRTTACMYITYTVVFLAENNSA